MALTISNLVPDLNANPGAPGAFSSVFATARLTPIEFDLTSIPADTTIVVVIKFQDRDETYVALDAAGDWRWPFDVDSSIGDLDSEPVHVSILPRGGWRPGTIELIVMSVSVGVEIGGDGVFDPEVFDVDVFQ